MSFVTLNWFAIVGVLNIGARKQANYTAHATLVTELSSGLWLGHLTLRVFFSNVG